MKLLIRNSRVIDPANKLDGIYDILAEDGKVGRVAKEMKAAADKTIDAAGKIVMPGIVDMHTHLREPGREDKETIASATLAALKGGVTSLLAMPNTTPAIDCAESADLLNSLLKKSAHANVFIAGTITKDRQGKELADIAKLRQKGAVAISDDGASVDNEALFFSALKKAKANKILVICHSIDKSLAGDGVVNLGAISTRLGLRGISKESEYKRVQRDIALAKKAGTSIHIAHLSCKESVEAVACAKKKGVKVTAETCPHYFTLSEEALLGFDTNFKINPPLRTQADVEAIKEGLKNGSIDAIASDHAPHTENEKDIEFDRAEFGTVGLETELAVSISELIAGNRLTWSELVEKLAFQPSRILGIDKGALTPGKDADLIIVSPEKEWVVTKESLVSKSKNSSFLGRKLKGVVEYTILAGKIVYEAHPH
ncbi:MAG: dihydroorotase [Candidatus Omnitrophota bacterium]|jgi:dihydroorotase